MRRTVLMRSAGAHVLQVLISMTKTERSGVAKLWVHLLLVGPQSHGKKDVMCLHGLRRFAQRSSLQIVAKPSVARRLATDVTKKTKIGRRAVPPVFLERDLATLVEIGVARNLDHAHTNRGVTRPSSASLSCNLHRITRQVLCLRSLAVATAFSRVMSLKCSALRNSHSEMVPRDPSRQ